MTAARSIAVSWDTAALEVLPGYKFGCIDGKGVQVCRREIGPEVRAMPPDRAVLHETVLEKHLLPRKDVSSG